MLARRLAEFERRTPRQLFGQPAGDLGGRRRAAGRIPPVFQSTSRVSTYWTLALRPEGLGELVEEFGEVGLGLVDSLQHPRRS